MKKIIFYIFLLFVAFSSCKDDEFTTDPQYRLEYSVDTINFDSIFGGYTTPYQTLKVYNNSGERINIESIHYTTNGYFMVNINGRKTSDVANVEIANGDSVSIFIQTNGDVSGSDVPFALFDSISFSYNGNKDYVYLSAFSETPIVLDHFVVSSDTTLSSTQPYFIKDTLKVEEGATLNIESGVRLYFYNGASLYVDGNLNCNGDVNNPIEMRYFRSDDVLKDTKYYLAPGNWRGVWLSQKSGDCNIISTNIIGAYRCLVVDSAFIDRKVVIGNSQIYNAKQGALIAEAANIYAYNTLFANGGYYNVYLTDGKYLFNHCTIASYLDFNLANRKAALFLDKKDSISVELNNSIVCGNNVVNKKKYDIDNSNHTLKDSVDGDKYRLDIVCSAIGMTDSLMSPNCYGNIWNCESKFHKAKSKNWIDNFYVDFKIDSLSQFRTLGSDAILKLYPECATDIMGKNRVDDEFPDAGAFEY